MFLFILIFSVFSFCLGQLGRVQLGNGVNFILLDVVAVLSLLFVLKNHQELKHINQPLATFLLALFASWTINSMRYASTDLMVGLMYLARLVAYTSIYFVVITLSKKRKAMTEKALLISGGLAVVLGFAQYFFYNNLRNLFYLGWDDHLYRLFSVFLDPNFAGILFVLYFIFLLGIFFVSQKKNYKMLIAFLACLTVIAVILTFSRTALIILFLGTIIFLLLLRKWKVLLVLLFSFALLLISLSDVKVEGLNPFRTASSFARVESAKIALTIFAENPIFGVGYNMYRYAQNQYGFRTDGNWKDSHADSGAENSYLFILATSGVMGFGTFLYFLYSLYTVARRLTLSDPRNVALIVSGVCVLVSALFINSLFYPFVLFLARSSLGY